MAQDPMLADRLRTALTGTDYREVKMFGGQSFMVNDQLTVSASNQGDLLLRCDPGDVESLTAEPHVRWAEMGSRRMSKGWLRVDPAGYAADDDLARWVDVALAHNRATTTSDTGG